MLVGGTPLDLSAPRLGWPAGARVQFGAAKARWLPFRRGRRIRLQVCVLTVVGKHQAVVTRITLYGATLRGGHRLKRREIIALRLPSGWRVKARVQWRFGSRCGIAFMTPVADFARILCEGAVVKPRGKRPRPPAPDVRPRTPVQDKLAPVARPDLAPPLAGLAAWAKARAEQIRAWAAVSRHGSDPHPD
jgi:hypothetical protein